MDSKRLYYNNSYMKEFETNIASCTPYGTHYALVLDETAFYPEGGGQPSDRGFIDEFEVIDVIEEDGQILHITDHAMSERKVKCKIDWSRRYDFMQQHTGQHILSHCFFELYNGSTDSFHMGTNYVSIEIDVNDFNQEKCEQIENMANEIIYRNLPVSAIIVNEEELRRIPLRKQPSVKDNIRVVKIGDIDYSPCGGTHTMNTGEIGLIKIIKWEKLKSSCRFEFLCGQRALSDYRTKNRLLLSLCAKLSVKDYDLDRAVDRVINENKNLIKEYANINKTLLKHEAEELYNQCEIYNGKRIIKSIFENRKFDEIKTLAGEITTHEKTIAFLCVLNDTAQIVFSRSDDIDINMNLLLKTVLPIIDGKGGGSSKTAQGGGSIIENIYDLMKEAYDQIKK